MLAAVVVVFDSPTQVTPSDTGMDTGWYPGGQRFVRRVRVWPGKNVGWVDRREQPDRVMWFRSVASAEKEERVVRDFFGLDGSDVFVLSAPDKNAFWDSIDQLNVEMEIFT